MGQSWFVACEVALCLIYKEKQITNQDELKLLQVEFVLTTTIQYYFVYSLHTLTKILVRITNTQNELNKMRIF